MEFNKFIHILNPNASHRRAVQRYFRDNPDLHSIWIDRKSHPTHLETVIEWAAMEGHHHLAVWGGDGTFSRVIEALTQSKQLDKCILALIPTGTGNDFARRFKLGSWKKWVKLFQDEKSQVHQFDIGMLEFDSKKRAFVNNAGFGRTKQALDRPRSNPIKDILGFTGKRLQVEWENDKVHQFETTDAYFGIVFNAPFFNKGMHFSTDIEPNDGILNAFIVPKQNKASLFAKFVKSRLGGRLGSSSDVRLDAQSLHIESDELLYPQVDGEPAAKDGVYQCNFSVLKGACNLLVPYENGHE